MTITTDIRVQLLGVDDSDILSDTYIALLLSDAKNTTGITDETNIALRYYTCFLIADNWESIGAVESREGVRYRKPEPKKYLAMYDSQLQKQLTSDDNFMAAKESTNEGNIFSDNGVMEKGNYPEN